MANEIEQEMTDIEEQISLIGSVNNETEYSLSILTTCEIKSFPLEKELSDYVVEKILASLKARYATLTAVLAEL